MFIWRDICHFSSRLATLENSSTPPHLSLFPIPSLYWSNEKDSVAVAVYHDIWTSQINLFLSANLFHHPLCYSDNFLFLSDETKQTSLTTCQRFKQSSHHLTGLSSGMIIRELLKLFAVCAASQRLKCKLNYMSLRQ